MVYLVGNIWMSWGVINMDILSGLGYVNMSIL